MTNDRADLVNLIARAVAFLGDRAQPVACFAADAVLAAGWRPAARVIETVEDADQLESGTAVRTGTGWIAECTGAPCWVLVGDKSPVRTSDLDFPAIVLFEPEEQP